ncbi:MAG: hypothetical protein KF763_14115 [Cyclobacteriaceae bacterium]|nr:hypothetical protein [Cyclobacteriaceae bacterium]
MRLLVLVCLLILTFSKISAQLINEGNYDIKDPKGDVNKCRQILTTLSLFPKEVRLSPRIENNQVLVYINGRQWFEALFQDKNDGIAVDIVQKSQFGCEPVPASSWFSHTGYLLKPLYRDDIRRSMLESPGQYTAITIGTIPDVLAGQSLEANYLLLQDKYLCYSGRMVNVDFHGWKLLETGLYYDTLTESQLTEKHKALSKTIHVSIPFEKNKSIYNQKDVQPLIDSLNLTDYAITKISIQAYTSIEGDYQRNLKLQQERAESMVGALQAFQKEKIESQVTTFENWVDFLNDIQLSPYKYLAALTKEEVKQELTRNNLESRLEPILKNHRKAIVIIQLEKRLSLRESDPQQLKKFFEQSILERNLDEARYLQQIIFHKIRKRELPDTVLQELRIPEANEMGSLLLNRASFLHDIGATDVFEAIQVFERLKTILPGNSKIDYNLCALHLEAWLYTDLLQPLDNLKKQIEALRAKKIPDVLVRRLLINYHIILSEVHMRNHNFTAKDKALQFIYQTYTPLKLNDADLLNLAKYFSHYSMFDWSIRLLQNRVKSIQASEDLLFYYLSLTIYNSRNLQSVGYRAIMLNAINQNRYRFCSQFNSSFEEGVSFQLLKEPVLKKAYCENCKDPF